MRYLILVLIFLTKLSFSQEVNGVIKYGRANVSFARIYVSKTSNGTFANSEGAFTLKVKSLKDTLVISATGYQLKKVVAKKVLENSVIQLIQTAQEIEIVTISSQSEKSKSIIKKVIQNRKANDFSDKNFTANLYTKSILDRRITYDGRGDTVQKSFAEKYSLIEHSNNKWKETKLGVKDLSIQSKAKGLYKQRWGSSPRRRVMNSQTKSNLFYSNISDGNFNFYNSTILIPKLAQNPFISPLGPLAFISYKYTYSGKFIEEGKTVHRIKIIPKRPEESVFNGYVQIEDSSWAIVSVELEMNGQKLHRYDFFKVYQRFKVEDSIRVLDRQEFFFYYNSAMGYKDYHGTVYSKFSNYSIKNEKIKIGNLIGIQVDSADLRTESFWKEKRSVKLTSKESSFIAATDSLEKLQKSEKYIRIQDSLKNKISIWEVVFTGVDHYNTPKGWKWRIDPLTKQARIFGIGGYRHALGGQFLKEFKNKNDLYVSTTVNYGFNNKDLLSDGKLKYTYSPRKFAQLRLSGGNRYEMLTYMQNLSSLFSRGNFVRNDFFSVGHSLELINGLFFDIDAKYIQRSSISNLNLSKWSEDLFGGENSPIEFQDYNEFNLKALLSYTPNQKYALEGRKKIIKGSKWPTFHLGWEQGIPNILSSKIDYQKVKLGSDYSFKLGLLGTSKVKTWFGQYLKTANVEVPNFTFFRGTDNYFFSHPLYTFQLLGETHTTLENYLTVNYIHHFHGAIIKKIPYLKKSKLEAVSGAGALYLNEDNFYHSEIFNGLEVPFRIGETKLKFGAYYAIANSSYSNISNMIKFGLNVFNPFTNEWAF